MNVSGKSRGRPRNREADHAILRVALKQLEDHGYAHMSIESVAAEAGVGKTTIYRRYRGKEDLATAAISELSDVTEVSDTGNARADLQELIVLLHRHFRRRRAMSMIGSLLVEEGHNPELMKLFRQRVILPRRARIREILERGIRRGEVRPGIDLEMAADCLIGASFAHYLSGLPTPSIWPLEVVDMVWRGIGTAPDATPSEG